MTSNLRAALFLGTYGASGNNQDARLALIKLLDEHAAEAIKAHEAEKWMECYRKVSEKN